MATLASALSPSDTDAGGIGSGSVDGAASTISERLAFCVWLSISMSWF
ncbi:hypothetical protein ACLQ26_27805 [Micromonospora sp. DT43]